MAAPVDRPGTRAAARHALLGVALALGTVAAPAGATPAAGRYEAVLCVRNADAPPNCGPAELSVRTGGQVRLQVSDIVWDLVLRDGQAAVVVSQGSVQLDEFNAPAEWSGPALRFVDNEKRLSYEVQIGAPRQVAR
jgi:hypothetical protein